VLVVSSGATTGSAFGVAIATVDAAAFAGVTGFCSASAAVVSALAVAFFGR